MHKNIADDIKSLCFMGLELYLCLLIKDNIFIKYGLLGVYGLGVVMSTMILMGGIIALADKEFRPLPDFIIAKAYIPTPFYIILQFIFIGIFFIMYNMWTLLLARFTLSYINLMIEFIYHMLRKCRDIDKDSEKWQSMIK